MTGLKNHHAAGEAPLTPQLQAELDALDAALRGEPIEDDQLAAMVRDVQATTPMMPAATRAELNERFGESRERAPRSRRRSLMLATGGLASVLVATVIVIGALAGQEPATQTITTGMTERGSGDMAAPPIAAKPESGAGALTEFQSRGGAATTTPEPAESTSRDRAVERGAALTVQVDAGKLAELPQRVESIARDAGGFVDSSDLSIQSQAGAGPSSGRFTLRVKTARLDDALSRLGELGVVTSQERTSNDITALVDSAERRRSDAQAERRALLRALGKASTDREISSLRSRIDDNRRRRAELQREATQTAQRADLATIQLSVQTDSDATTIGDDGRWGLDDALGDAGRALTLIGGTLIVAGTVLLPFGAVLAAGLWVLGVRRRNRDAALGD